VILKVLNYKKKMMGERCPAASEAEHSNGQGSSKMRSIGNDVHKPISDKNEYPKPFM